MSNSAADKKITNFYKKLQIAVLTSANITAYMRLITFEK